MLNRLLNITNYDVSTDQLVLLGDYIDRGPDPVGTMNLVENLVAEGAVALAGNHEYMLISYLCQKISIHDYFFNGGATTLKSYDALGEKREEILQRHLRFIGTMPLILETQNYIFTHAGINPSKSLENQTNDDVLWIREKFLYHPTNLDKTVIFGHTPTFTLGTDKIWINKNKIGIDTGAGQNRVLSILELPQGNVYSIDVKSSKSLPIYNMSNI